MFEYEVFLNTWVKRGEDEYILRLLEVTQWIRVVKYIPDPVVKKDIHRKTKPFTSKQKTITKMSG